MLNPGPGGVGGGVQFRRPMASSASNSYADVMNAVKTLVQTIGRVANVSTSLADPKTYGYLWTARAFIVAELICSGRHLTVPPTATTEILSKAFPDQKNKAVQFAKHFRA